MPPKKNTLVLIDGHSTLYKAFHGLKTNLTNSRGEPTAAIYGFLTTFFRLQKQLESAHIVVVFDPPGKTFRDEIYTEYKANRPPMEEDLRAQEKRVRQVLDIMQVPVMEVPGFEADDVIASLALQAVESDGEVLVCSSDKDLLQIVRPGIKIWREHLQKSELLDEQGVIEKTEVRPDQIAAYLGLMGDTSDNIPGVPGVGKKTAAKLLNEHDTIEGILAAVPSMKKSKVRDNLEQFADQARLSEQLATLKTDCVEGEFSWERFHWELRPTQDLREFYREMNFQSFLQELGGDTVEDRDVDYGVITTRADLEKAVAAIRKAGLASIDTETTDLDPFLADLVGISISWKKNQAVYIPLGHNESDIQITLDDVREILAPTLTDSRIRWVAHHWDFDYKILKVAGLSPGHIASDTMIAAYIVNPDRSSNSYRLKDLALSILGVQMTEISELIGDGDDMVTMASVTVADTAQYACQDADITLQLHLYLEKEIKAGNLEKLYSEVEVPLITVLAEMELEGVRIDRDYFRRLSKEAEKTLEKLTGEIYKIAGREFKINSPKQLGELLFDELGLTTGKKGKSGAYSTDVTVLETLKNEHPLPAKVLEYRQVEKLKNTYIDPLPNMVNPRTGRLHTSFNQTIAATGRLSSSNPNLQNIPVRTEDGRAIRRGFLSRQDGWKLLAADYSQIELRILAHLSKDEALCDAFRSEKDIHRLTASKVFGYAEDEVTSEQRGQAKAVNFGIIYGMSEFRLARDFNLSNKEAKEFIQNYFRVYSGVHQFIEETKEKARKDGFVTTMLGRRRFIPDIRSRNYNQRSFAERIAVNTPIQGTSADMIKAAMIRIANRLLQMNVKARMILQVHDELIFDMPEEEVEIIRPIVHEEMVNALPLDVPVKVDMEVGDSWDVL